MSDERHIKIRTPHGEFQVWAQRRGSSPHIKLLLLHGGPGATSEYFECLDPALPDAGIELIFYDQLGSHRSAQPDIPALWELPRFVDEAIGCIRRPVGSDVDAQQLRRIVACEQVADALGNVALFVEGRHENRNAGQPLCVDRCGPARLEEQSREDPDLAAAPQGATRPDGGHALGWRAADAGDRPRPRVLAEVADAR